jgi:hypothetical protein
VAGQGVINRMSRLFIHVEGQTEESFVNNVLYAHLTARGYTNVSARLMGNARQRSSRGGVRSWSQMRREIARHLLGDREAIATVMVDYYAMPLDWPGRQLAATQTGSAARASIVQSQMAQEVANEMGAGFDPRRFVPFVLMHEFEALLFSDCKSFADLIGNPALEASMQAIIAECGAPEDIDDSPHTAPSKRLKAILPGYEKVVLGTLAALEMGVETIRQNCPNFRDWTDRLAESAGA